jgi:hypothetical protein
MGIYTSSDLRKQRLFLEESLYFYWNWCVTSNICLKRLALKGFRAEIYTVQLFKWDAGVKVDVTCVVYFVFS